MSFFKKSDGDKHRLVIMITGNLKERIDSLVTDALSVDLGFDLADVLDEGIGRLERQLKKLLASEDSASNKADLNNDSNCHLRETSNHEGPTMKEAGLPASSFVGGAGGLSD